MSKAFARFIGIIILVSYIVHFTTAQMTLSKGWGPGKRAALYDGECKVNAKSLVLLFHTLMGEVKQLMACDQATINYLQSLEH